MSFVEALLLIGMLTFILTLCLYALFEIICDIQKSSKTQQEKMIEIQVKEIAKYRQGYENHEKKNL